VGGVLLLLDHVCDGLQDLLQVIRVVTAVAAEVGDGLEGGGTKLLDDNGGAQARARLVRLSARMFDGGDRDCCMDNHRLCQPSLVSKLEIEENDAKGVGKSDGDIRSCQKETVLDVRTVVVNTIDLTELTRLEVSSPVANGVIGLAHGEVCHDEINHDRLGRAIAKVGADVGVPDVPLWALVWTKPTQVVASYNRLNENHLNSLHAPQRYTRR